MLQGILGKNARAVKAFAHVRSAGCQPHLCVRRNRDHALDLSAATISANRIAETSEPQRILMPQGSSISTKVGCRSHGVDESSSDDGAISLGRLLIWSALISTGIKAASAPNFFFQLKSRLALRSYLRDLGIGHTRLIGLGHDALLELGAPSPTRCPWSRCHQISGRLDLSGHLSSSSKLTGRRYWPDAYFLV